MFLRGEIGGIEQEEEIGEAEEEEEKREVDWIMRSIEVQQNEIGFNHTKFS